MYKFHFRIAFLSECKDKKNIDLQTFLKQYLSQ